MCARRIGDYELTGVTLGEGTYGTVEEARHIETDERVAIKIARTRHHNALRRESALLSRLRHPHIINVKEPEPISDGDDLCVVLELAPGGEIFDYIASKGCNGACECGCGERCVRPPICKCRSCGCRHFDEPTARHYFTQLISGVAHCHSRGVCHLDLKPENLLLDENESLRICDFGLSAVCTSPSGEPVLQRAIKIHNPTSYTAPEVLRAVEYSGQLADIWSCGVILFVMLTGRFPWNVAQPTDKFFHKLTIDDYTYPQHLSEEAEDLLAGIFVIEPQERMTLDDVWKHDWLQLGSKGIAMDLSSTPAAAAQTSPAFLNSKLSVMYQTRTASGEQTAGQPLPSGGSDTTTQTTTTTTNSASTALAAGAVLSTADITSAPASAAVGVPAVALDTAGPADVRQKPETQRVMKTRIDLSHPSDRASSPKRYIKSEFVPFPAVGSPPLFQDNVKCSTRFTTLLGPREALKRIIAELAELDIHTSYDSTFKLRGVIALPDRTTMTFTMQLFLVQVGTLMVEFRRGQVSKKTPLLCAFLLLSVCMLSVQVINRVVCFRVVIG
eukprot:TRINITY_DN4990_c0_g1_i2.p1 TRINITY_DN4990_c0_g1~~TRINITY_DN4990_c0_g1_i2.p1  ORF type:complete len:557 (-),score=71.52 TRINITY_DN4990_c0_g1_i2:208-1878(-)